ncbi:YbjQ family protein [Desulfonema ishimotonii]|uniref:YbjQ family protein n=1 Tax=Desulfonema ishimotonii TaxID=45657 RepID=A0A401FW67_9BACT|nr:heavy metal-binding domain-containing protein [Desulfonema ishimotonii]GBC61217.1 YbjQ family protein [Desulfonema ishimotonii]
MAELIINLGIPLCLIALGYFCGTWTEQRHYRSIEAREKALVRLPATTAKNVDVNEADVERAEMVWGSVVVSNDYFKRLLAALRNIFGGRVKSYESLVDRARREAMLRMKEMAPDATIILNVRLETATIGRSANKKGMVGSVEALAWGTALTLRQ